MLGISWGIVSVVMLLAYGNGFRDALSRGFANAFGDGVVISGLVRRACRQGGSAPGERVRVKVDDALQLKDLPLVKASAPNWSRICRSAYGTSRPPT